jgi:methyl coenzyme M reductase subunit C
MERNIAEVVKVALSIFRRHYRKGCCGIRAISKLMLSGQ